jgi:hypothetical protein
MRRCALLHLNDYPAVLGLEDTPMVSSITTDTSKPVPDHDGRFTNTRLTGYKHELWRTFSHDSVEGCEQGIDLALPPIQPPREEQPV